MAKENKTRRALAAEHAKPAVANPLTIFRAGALLPVRSFYSERRESVMWIHWSHAYSAPAAFWDLFACIVQTLWKESLPALADDPPPWDEALVPDKLAAFLSQIKPTEPRTLVLQNAHLLEEGPATVFVECLRQCPVPDLTLLLLNPVQAELCHEGRVEYLLLVDPSLVVSREEIRVYLYAQSREWEGNTLDYLCQACQNRFAFLLDLLAECGDHLTVADIHRAASKTALGPPADTIS